jgi:DNA polymerase-3 subunit alpha
VPEWSDQKWLDGERETLGLYLTGHPINQYLAELKHYTSGRLCDLQPTERDKPAVAAGLVLNARIMVTKRGTKMGILTLDDRSGRLDITLFSEALERYESLLQKDRILVVTGQISFDEYAGGIKMSAREVLEIEDARARHARGLRVKVTQSEMADRFMRNLPEILTPHRAGVCPVHICYRRSGAQGQLTLGTEWRVTPTDQLLNELRAQVGKQDVELIFE